MKTTIEQTSHLSFYGSNFLSRLVFRGMPSPYPTIVFSVQHYIQKLKNFRDFELNQVINKIP